MSKEWIAAVAAAEIEAQQKQSAEEAAYEQFDAARAGAGIEAGGDASQVAQLPEFHRWMDARRVTDEAWGAWAMVMDAKPAS